MFLFSSFPSLKKSANINTIKSLLIILFQYCEVFDSFVGSLKKIDCFDTKIESNFKEIMIDFISNNDFVIRINRFQFNLKCLFCNQFNNVYNNSGYVVLQFLISFCIIMKMLMKFIKSNYTWDLNLNKKKNILFDIFNAYEGITKLINLFNNLKIFENYLSFFSCVSEEFCSFVKKHHNVSTLSNITPLSYFFYFLQKYVVISICYLVVGSSFDFSCFEELINFTFELISYSSKNELKTLWTDLGGDKLFKIFCILFIVF
jgi:hypothetical protein